MTPPKDVFELADQINNVTFDPDINKMIEKSPWIKAFTESPKMKISERRKLFDFLLHLSLLKSAQNDDMNKTKCVLAQLRNEYFNDNDLFQPSIALKDINNQVDGIFR